MDEFISAEADDCQGQSGKSGYCLEFLSACKPLAGFMCYLCVKTGFLKWSEQHIDPLNCTDTAFTLLF